MRDLYAFPFFRQVASLFFTISSHKIFHDNLGYRRERYRQNDSDNPEETGHYCHCQEDEKWRDVQSLAHDHRDQNIIFRLLDENIENKNG